MRQSTQKKIKIFCVVTVLIFSTVVAKQARSELFFTTSAVAAIAGVTGLTGYLIGNESHYNQPVVTEHPLENTLIDDHPFSYTPPNQQQVTIDTYQIYRDRNDHRFQVDQIMGR